MPQTPDDLPPADEEALSDERLPLTELENISERPPSWRKRGAQLGLLALALCVGLAATWSVIVPKQQAAQPAMAPIPISALLVSNLTNATITLNGKKLAGHPPMVISAYLQTDEITISAPLFHAHTCHFNGLVTKSDNAHCLFTINSVTGVSAQYIIGVYLTPDDLLPAQKNQVVAPIMQQLAIAQQTTTQPGDYIATAAQDDAITSQLATTSLQASATFVQAGPLQAYSVISPTNPFSPSCAQLICPLGFGPAPFQTPAGQVWGLLLNVVARWRFTNSAGAAIADVTYQFNPEAGYFLPLPEVQFIYGATGWTRSTDTNLSDELPNILCSDGIAILQQHLILASFSYSIQMGTNRGAEGCLISVQRNEQNSTFLWRFGVLLAADAGAQTIWPDLPIASPAAIAAVSG